MVAAGAARIPRARRLGLNLQRLGDDEIEILPGQPVRIEIRVRHFIAGACERECPEIGPVFRVEVDREFAISRPPAVPKSPAGRNRKSLLARRGEAGPRTERRCRIGPHASCPHLYFVRGTRPTSRPLTASNTRPAAQRHWPSSTSAGAASAPGWSYRSGYEYPSADRSPHCPPGWPVHRSSPVSRFNP